MRMKQGTQQDDIVMGKGDFNDNTEELDPKKMMEELHKRALAMGIKQNQLGRLNYVRVTKDKKWKKVKNCLLRTTFYLSCLLSTLVIVWTLDWPIPRTSLAHLVWRMSPGDDTISSEPCLVDASSQVQDLARPPLSCEFCQGVTGVERVSKLSSQEFQKGYAYSGQPVVVTDGATDWTAVQKFSFDFFKGIYTPESPVFQSDCQFFPYRTEFHNLSQVFQMDEKRAQLRDGSAPWYIGWSNCDISVASILRQHYSKPYFLPEDSESSKTDWIFMGSPGYGAHMHVDNVGLPSWQAQITGHKLWTLEPPPECYMTCVSKLEVTVHPGEIIVLDTNKWYHSTLVTGEEISITIGSEFD